MGAALIAVWWPLTAVRDPLEMHLYALRFRASAFSHPIYMCVPGLDFVVNILFIAVQTPLDAL